MKPDTITVSDLFDKPRRYLIPIFQRGYVWTLEGQWKPLWQDILNQAEALRTHDPERKREIRKHFLGAFVVNQANMGVRHVATSEVIDGQQRLITLQVILAAFRDGVAPLNSQFLYETLRRLTENQGQWPDEMQRHKVWPTNAFRQDFQAIMSAGSAETLSNSYPLQRIPRARKRKYHPRPPLVEAYLYFSEAITNYLRGADDSEETTPSDASLSGERAELLLDTITRHIQLVEILLGNEDDPQVIFETLNARGVELKPSDLIRNFVFLYATRHNEKVEAIYDACWKDLDESPTSINETRKFWKETERQGRLCSTRLDLFMYHYLIYKTQHDLKITQIFQEFRDWWYDTETDRVAATELKTLRKSADVFRGLLQPDRTSRFGVFAYRLRLLDTTTIYPLLLMLAEKRENMLQGEFDAMLDDLESYLVRRAVCNLTPKNYNRVCLALIRGLQAEATPTRAQLRKEMLAMEGESTVWPDDEMFRRHWLNEPTYGTLGPLKTRMILEALDLQLQTSRQERLHIDDYLTIEHVMPQGGNAEDWPPPPPSTDGSINFDAVYRRGKLLHSLGNLTLLTQPLNSSVSNGPFNAKRREICLQSRLQLNAYFQQFTDEDKWTEQAIGDRTEELFRLAQTIWPYPAKSQC